MSKAEREAIKISPEEYEYECERLERLRGEGEGYQAKGKALLAQPHPTSLDIWLLCTTLEEHKCKLDQAMQALWRLDVHNIRVAFCIGAAAGAVFSMALIRLTG